MRVRTLIVDDESLARDRLRQLLQAEAEVEIIGECSNGLDAVEAIRVNLPDLVFLDVQMPELDGFGVLEAIRDAAAPVVVFVTAHDKFALRAFEVHAVDYLLKPFDRERFQTALSHAMDQVKRKDDGSMSQRLAELLAGIKAPQPASDRLAVKAGGRIIFVPFKDIDSLEAAHNYVEVHAGKETHLLRQTFDSIEERMPAEKFVRISRSAIVNVDRIRELQPLFHGEYSVTLHNGRQLTLSRRYRDKLKLLGV